MTDQPHEPPPRKPNGTKTPAGNRAYIARRKAALELRQANGDDIRLRAAQRKIPKHSAYKPEYCETVIADARMGHSLAATADLIGVDRSTMTRWTDRYPEFAIAVARANAARLRGYETELIDIRRNGGDSSRLGAVKFAMTNVSPEDWKERFESTSNVNVSLSSLITDAMKTIEHEATQPKRLAKPDEDE